MKVVKINTEYITLGQVLKFAGIISNGGDVKFFLSENRVWVNNELDNRRGRKLYHNDIVRIEHDVTLKIENDN